MINKDIRVLLKDDAKESFICLKNKNDKNSQTLINSIKRAVEILKQNPQFGDPIKKDLIPKKLKKLGIQNLYRMELSNYWRMLYTIEGTKIEIFVFILNIVDHKKYNKLFGYK